MAVVVAVEIIGLRDLSGRFARYSVELSRYGKDEIKAFLPRFVTLLRKHAPVGKTKVFRDSFYGKVLGGDKTEVRFYSRDPRAPHIMFKTKPHEIRAWGKALRFLHDTKVIFRNKVSHPGTSGSNFAELAFIEGADDFIRVMNKAGARSVIYLSGKGGESS